MRTILEMYTVDTRIRSGGRPYYQLIGPHAHPYDPVVVPTPFQAPEEDALVTERITIPGMGTWYSETPLHHPMTERERVWPRCEWRSGVERTVPLLQCLTDL